jgi:hypothetical protein
MKLYELDLNLQGPRLRLTLEGTFALSDDGDWSVPDSGVAYLGQTSGYWDTKSNDDGSKEIWLWETDFPNFVSFLWRDMPFSICHLKGFQKLPLSIGQTGTGLTLPLSYSKFPVRRIDWKVVNRGF